MPKLNKGVFSSAHGEWWTPRYIVDAVLKAGGYKQFNIDLTATGARKEDEPVPALYHCTDIFNFTTSPGVNFLGVRPLLWMNPPYGKTGGHELIDFIAEALRILSATEGVLWLCLPARTDTDWFHLLVREAEEIGSHHYYFLDKRVQFNEWLPFPWSGSGKRGSPAFPTVLVRVDTKHWGSPHPLIDLDLAYTRMIPV